MEDKKLLDRIQVDPKVTVAEAVIKGTSLTVKFILNLVANGASASDITQEYAGVTETDIDACLLFEKRMRAEELLRLLAEGEKDISAGRVRSARSFLKEFKSDHDIGPELDRK
ncbi:MAG: hypothetical protein QOH70_291 [Blastocatellia bacterium]|jgi:uncharacterized protein (DUF433 family)|nr:hypothetical protein [Blastocatellia bacterium]